MQKTLINSVHLFNPRPGQRLFRRLVPLLVLVAGLALWQGVALFEIYPPFIIPPPQAVFEKFIAVVADGRLWAHTQVTLTAVLAGLVSGASVGAGLGYLIAKNRLLEQTLSPIVVALQSTPIVAYAPLLVIWFGSGPESKIITSALIVFFPTLMNTVVGMRNVPLPLRDLMRTMRATRWQMFTKLEVPAAMPILLGGLKISATLAVIGAVVGEFIGAKAGLGVMITLARSQYDTALVLVGVIVLAIIARVLYGLVALIEWHALAWQRRSRRDQVG